MSNANNNKMLIIDIETTGFLNQGGSIVEVGIVELNLDNGDREIMFDSVCREKILAKHHREPPFGWIFENSDLTVEKVRNAPAFDKIKPIIQSIILEYKLGCTAFNRTFDIDFLKDRKIVIPFLQPCPMITCIPVLKLKPTAKMKKWKKNIKYKTPNAQEAYNFFFPDEKYIEKHRAADDAMHEAAIVYKLYKMGVYKLCPFTLQS